MRTEKRGTVEKMNCEWKPSPAGGKKITSGIIKKKRGGRWKYVIGGEQ